MFICAIQQIPKCKKIIIKHDPKFWKMLNIIKLVLAAKETAKNIQNLRVMHKLENHYTTYN